MANVTLSPFPTTASPSQRTSAVACIKDTISGGSVLSDDRAAALGETASELVERYAPDAPQAVKNESVLRLAGWVQAREPKPLQSFSTGEMRFDFRERFYTPNAMRNSGAYGLLKQWRRRRALAVEEAG